MAVVSEGWREKDWCSTSNFCRQCYGDALKFVFLLGKYNMIVLTHCSFTALYHILCYAFDEQSTGNYEL